MGGSFVYMQMNVSSRPIAQAFSKLQAPKSCIPDPEGRAVQPLVKSRTDLLTIAAHRKEIRCMCDEFRLMHLLAFAFMEAKLLENGKPWLRLAHVHRGRGAGG